MDREALEELKKLCEKATPGPWDILGQLVRGAAHNVDGIDEPLCDLVAMVGAGHDDDRAFIAAARTALPKLIAEVERYQKDSERITKLLQHGLIDDCGTTVSERGQIDAMIRETDELGEKYPAYRLSPPTAPQSGGRHE